MLINYFYRMSQNTENQTNQTHPQEVEEKGEQFIECEVCGKKVRSNMYKRHMSGVHGFITKEEFSRLKEEVQKTIQSSIHSALEEHGRGHYKSLKELLEEGEKHAQECPQCRDELAEWLERKRKESYKKTNRKWL